MNNLKQLSIDMKVSDWEAFIVHVWQMGSEHARNSLPWRNIDDPYAIWVSEAMLQQTQVSRVLNYWPVWMNRFPTVDALSSAAPSDVLEAWQGLGYNRRALNMKRTADICSAQWQGNMPTSIEDLRTLPGIGPATAAGIVSFAYQRPAVYLETNVRAVFLHHFFADEPHPVSDKQLIPLVKHALSGQDPRAWNYALLDYGHYLKQTYPNPTRKSASYTRQSPFEGSVRQKRSFIVREVLASPGIDMYALHDALCVHEQSTGREAISREDFENLVSTLESEGFFHRRETNLIP